MKNLDEILRGISEFMKY
jgi:hypothetical protein